MISLARQAAGAADIGSGDRGELARLAHRAPLGNASPSLPDFDGKDRSCAHFLPYRDPAGKVGFGRIARLQWSPWEGPESAP